MSSAGYVCDTCRVECEKKKKKEGERMSEVEEERESECVYGGRGQIESVRWSTASKLAGK